MSAKWQQWVPFHIDRFMGSASVRAMERLCRWGYWMLLCRAWQSDDCTVSADPLDLAQDSDLGDDLWAQYGPRILRKFEVLENGRLRNAVLFEEWKTAKSKFEKTYASEEEVRRVRSEAGKKGAIAKLAKSKSVANATLTHGNGWHTEQDNTEQDSLTVGGPDALASPLSDPEDAEKPLDTIPEGLTIDEAVALFFEQTHIRVASGSKLENEVRAAIVELAESSTPAEAVRQLIGCCSVSVRANVKRLREWLSSGEWRKPTLEQADVPTTVPDSADITLSPEMVASAVITELRISGQRLRMVLEEVARNEMAAGADPTDLRDRMVCSGERYQRAKPNLKFFTGLDRFFGEGAWRDEDGWPWKDGEAPKPKVAARAEPPFAHPSRVKSMSDIRAEAGIQ